MSEIRVRVARKRDEAIDIASFELLDINGGLLPAFSAGSHIDVYLQDGVTRQYSLCNDTSETHRYLIGVLRDPMSRGGSKALHDLVAEGDVLRISAPKNHFPLSHHARHSILLAGGIGVTPILCMAERLSNLAASFEMHYCVRAPERAAFAARIRAAAFGPKVNFHFDDGDPQQKLDLNQLLATPSPGVHLYVCGPKGFMDAVLDRARLAGWAEDIVHYEFFSAAAQAASERGAFQIKLASSGRIVNVSSEQTAVQALAGAGVMVVTSCEQGVCGTCLTRVLEGVPDHKDLYLSSAEKLRNDQFLPCCSRSKTQMIVVDL